MPIKYIFITSGVVSSPAKGLTSASIGQLLEARGLSIALVKLDPCLNVDLGKMSSFQHKESYVTDDGTEADLDLGHYYRFTNSPLSKASHVTAGQIYDAVIKKEGRGDYLGKMVQVIPHMTDEIKAKITAVGVQEKKTQVVIVEMGGTVGDMESLPFLEAVRQIRQEKPKDCLHIHLTYVSHVKASGEVVTKPTQHSVQLLREAGLMPELLLCRSEKPLSSEVKEKISLFCSLPKEAVFSESEAKQSIYAMPIELHQAGLDAMIATMLGFDEARPPDLSPWKKMMETALSPRGRVVVGIVGDHLDRPGAYKSLFEALQHGAIAAGVEAEIFRFEADKIVENGSVEKTIKGCDGYLIPAGFADRGWEGKLLTARYCREKKIPYLGLGVGMQVMLVEFARNVLSLLSAHSTEVNPHTPDPVVALLSEQKAIPDLGGAMRLGSYPCSIKKGTLANRCYGHPLAHERHRHRYEFNNRYKEAFESKGMVFSGILQEGNLCEIAELSHHPWMLGTQFHPEFKSKPLSPHPLFKDFIRELALNKQIT